MNHSRGGGGPSHSPQTALRESLASLGLPSGLLSSVLQSYQSCDARMWLIDNSAFMKVRDSHIGRGGSDGIIERVDNISRWQELQEAVAFHAKMASYCWMPTRYWLVNHQDGLGGDGKHHKFNLCWSTPKDVPNEMYHIKQTMQSAILDQSKCQLTRFISSISKSVAKVASDLSARDKNMTVVLCTQGMPTNSKGQSGTTIRQEFREEVWALSKLPVKIIIRLCTDDEKVRDMFNDMDGRFDSVDVLDDYWGEAMEVYLYNPWLTYSIGLHRLREAGLAPDVLGDLDERPLTLDEIHQLCLLLFGGEDGSVHLPLPPYQPTASAQLKRDSWVEHWIPFIIALEGLVEKEKLQWNPIKKKMTPWVNVNKLKSSLKEQLGESSHPDFDLPSRRQHQNTARSQRHAYPQPDSSFEKPQPKRCQSSRRTDGQRSKRGEYAQQDASSKKAQRWHYHTLTELLQHWSHQAPDYKRMHPLQNLFITMPWIFPPMNSKVEPHDYFTKWKKFDKEAFADVSGDELKELLRRAVRKAKFFLHPDKLPKDLTENQTLLFKTLWNVITEREAATFG